MTTDFVKRSRTSPEQLSHMVDFLIDNAGLAGGKFKKLHGKLEFEKKWAELAERLNCLGGAVKTANQWQTVWRELKSRTSVKVREWRKQQAQTGNRPLSKEPLNVLERRVVAIIGNDYIEGHQSVDESIPMEENLQVLLETDECIVVHSPSNTQETSDLRCDTPSTSRTPVRGIKRKRVADDSETKKQFLEIANKQAEAIMVMSDAIKTIGEGLKEIASAIGGLSTVIGKM